MIQYELKQTVEKVLSVKVHGCQTSSLSSLIEYFLSEIIEIIAALKQGLEIKLTRGLH